MRGSVRPPAPPSVPALRAPGGPKHARYDLFTAVGAGVWIAPRSGWYWVLAYGPGGNGGSSPGTAASGGGGGGAAGKRVRLNRGQPVAYSISAPGAPTTVQVAGLFSLSAGHGAAGGVGFVLGGAGGIGTGGDLNRTGGRGHGNTNPNGDPNDDDGVVVPATDGEYGGPGDPSQAGAGSGAGGGGGAGFRDILPHVFGRGSSQGFSIPVGSPGGGGVGSTGGAPGGAGGGGAIAFVYDG